MLQVCAQRGSPGLARLLTASSCWCLQQTSTFAAYPAVSCELPETDADSPSSISHYARRLREMDRTSAAAQPSYRQSTADLPARTAPLRQHLQRQLPSREDVAATLRLKQPGGCALVAAPAVTEPAVLDWREVVDTMRARQARLAGEEMLTDTFGRKHTYLRISLTERCNLRCLYCMPEQGVDLTPHEDLLSTAEIVRLARLFVEAGVDKIRLTGGEPTLRADILDLTRQLHALPGLRHIGLTSNGIALKRKLADLQANGLTLLNLSLDTLRADRFEAMTRRRGHERVLQTMQNAVDLGFDPVKVNVVVMKGLNDDEIPEFVELTRHLPVNVRFIEYMPFDGNVWSDSKMVTYKDMMSRVQAAFPQGLQRCQDPRGEVAKNFRVPGFRGSVSFVTSMTAAFCSDCNRLRIMADGNLKVCLFGANEVRLKDALREGATDDDLRCIISAAVDRKKAAHAGMFELAKNKNRAMVKIGG